MKTKTRLLWLITMLPTIITAAAVQFMPDSVPAHYNFKGEIDRWGSKYENFIMPAVIIVMTAFWLAAIASADKKAARAELDEKQRKEAASNAKVLYYAAAATTLFETALHCVMMYNDFKIVNGEKVGLGADYFKISGVILGVLIVVLGNIIPKVKRNALFGVRTKWSLADDENWRVTNRFGGGLLMIGGLLTITESLILEGMATMIIAVAIMLACCAMCVLYSYLAYIGRKRKGENDKDKNL
ncbi:MAG: SdpI family protein [Butyrivibrio sp.]|nr:SdpI family protein [Butyrivibrio sp.]